MEHPIYYKASDFWIPTCAGMAVLGATKKIVIPAQAGIQCGRRDVSDEIPARVTGPRPSLG